MLMGVCGGSVIGVCGWNPIGVGGPNSGPCINMASVGAAGVGGAAPTNVLSNAEASAPDVAIRVLSAAATDALAS